jgi:hypothetical protein
MRTFVNFRSVGAGIALICTLVSCRERGCDPPPTDGQLALRVEYVVGEEGLPFHLDSTYLTLSDDLVRVSHLKYYVSRVRLQRADSSVWTCPVPPFLLNAGTLDRIVLPAVPFGAYIGVSFDIGVDSATNSRLDWDGDLSSVNQMQWSWRTGYKFLSLDGKWIGDPAAPSIVEYHIGTASTLRTVNLPLQQPVEITPNASVPTVVLAARPITIFGGPNTMILSNAQGRNVMFATTQALQVADNYATMFRMSRVE